MKCVLCIYTTLFVIVNSCYLLLLEESVVRVLIKRSIISNVFIPSKPLSPPLPAAEMGTSSFSPSCFDDTFTLNNSNKTCCSFRRSP